MDLDDLDRNFSNILKRFPEIRRDLLTDVGETIQTKVLNNIATLVEPDKGRLNDSVQKIQKTGYVAIKPEFSKAPHTHLVENGHRNIARGKASEGSTGDFVKNGKYYVEGKHMYRNAYHDSINEIEGKISKVQKDIVNSFWSG